MTLYKTLLKRIMTNGMNPDSCIRKKDEKSPRNWPRVRWCFCVMKEIKWI